MEHEYKLIMNSSQARTVLKAVELLMRLKINQPKEIIWDVMDTETNRKDPEFYEHRENAEKLLEQAFNQIFAFKLSYPRLTDADWKDAEWYRLYNTYQVIRHALHDAENPEGDGIDKEEPMQFTEEPLPGIEWR